MDQSVVVVVVFVCGFFCLLTANNLCGGVFAYFVFEI